MNLSNIFNANDPEEAEYETFRHRSRTEISVDALDGALLEIRPYEDNPGIEAAANLLQSLHGVRVRDSQNVSSAHSFEIWYDPRPDDQAAFNYRLYADNPRARKRFLRKVEGSYPNTKANIVEKGHAFPPISDGHHVAASRLDLMRHTFVPIRHHNGSEGFPHGDPYGDVLREMLTIDDSIAVLQVVFKPAMGKWHEDGPEGRSVDELAGEMEKGESGSLSNPYTWWRYLADGGEIPVKEPSQKDKDAAAIVRQQRGKQAFRVCIRVLTASPDPKEARERAYGIGDQFSSFYNTPTEQGFEHHPLDPERLPDIYRKMVRRYYNSDTPAMILTTDELAGVAHVSNREAGLPDMPFREVATGEQVSSRAPDMEISHEDDSEDPQPDRPDGHREVNVDEPPVVDADQDEDDDPVATILEESRFAPDDEDDQPDDGEQQDDDDLLFIDESETEDDL
jgi:hypothetical protein